MGNRRSEYEVGDKAWRATECVEFRVGIDERGDSVRRLGAHEPRADTGADDREFDEGPEEQKDSVVIVHACSIS